MKKIRVIIEGGDGLYSAYATNLQSVSLNGQGDSVDEAKNDMMIALDEVKEFFTQENMPQELMEELDFEYRYDMQSLFNSFKMINVSEFARANGFNESLLRQYKNGLAFASEKQTKKIQKALHQLGQSLIEVKLI